MRRIQTQEKQQFEVEHMELPRKMAAEQPSSILYAIIRKQTGMFRTVLSVNGY